MFLNVGKDLDICEENKASMIFALSVKRRAFLKLLKQFVSPNISANINHFSLFRFS